MSAIEVFNNCRVMLLKINVISGFNLPENEFNNILVEQVCKKMVESYSNVNVDEVEYAFRNKDLSIKDWGKYLNISILDEVLIPYLEKRYEISKIEESIKSKLTLVENKRELTHKDMEDWVEETKKVATDISKVFIIPVEIYDWLVENKRLDISKEEKFKCVGHAINIRHTQLSDIALSGNHNDTKLLNEFIAMKKTGLFVGKESETIKRLSKKIVVFNYLKNNYNERTD